MRSAEVEIRFKWHEMDYLIFFAKQSLTRQSCRGGFVSSRQDIEQFLAACEERMASIIARELVQGGTK